MKLRRKLVGKADTYVFASESVEIARQLLPKVQQDKSVRKAFNNRYFIAVADEEETCGDPGQPHPCWDGPGLPHGVVAPFQPLEEYFYPDPGNHFGQWHLDNDAGMPHIEAVAAWEQGVTGYGVVIGVVDSGMDMTHVDLNIAESLSHDFVQDDTDPSPSAYAVGTPRA
ncbi:MAG: hypothetical protein LJE70_20825, partial [Chromatiaceae bacterium]|nr:hypothetical protein [Chromatiaceae bacterium]